MTRARPVILLTNPMHPEPLARLEAHGQVRVAPATDAASLTAAAADAAVIIVRAPLPPEALAGARLRGAIRHGAGVDMVPVEEASRRGLAVANVPGANAVSVAEYVVGQIIALTHRLRQIDATLRASGWAAARALAEDAHEVAGRTIGIVGLGAIGREVARMGHHGLNARILGARRSDAPMPEHVEAASIAELFARSDVVVLACPLTESTRGLVDAALLRAMKPGAVLVNVARGPVVDEPALIAALADGTLAGAALDVFTEQPLPATSPLLSMPNVILSTHLAGLTVDAMRRVGEGAADQAIQLLEGQLPRHLFNTEAEAAIRARLAQLGPS